MKNRLKSIPPEAVLWLGALASLAFLDPQAPSHFSFCLFKNLGVSFCPGCGLGHAIAYLYHGQISASFAAHPLGVPAVLIIGGRVVRLLRPVFRSTKQTTPIQL